MEFTVPKWSICFHSDFFRTACNGRWETIERTHTIYLDTIDPVIFGIFLTWMYTGSLKFCGYQLPSIEGISVNALLDSATSKQWDILAKCFVAADFLQAPNFQNVVCDALIHNSKIQSTGLSRGKVGGSGHREVAYIWEHTMPNSAIRSIVLNQMITRARLDPTDWLDDSRDFCLDLLLRTTAWFRRGVALENVWEDDPCIYHTHPGDTREYSCITKKELVYKTSDKLT
jgi:hypothetical protein